MSSPTEFLYDFFVSRRGSVGSAAAEVAAVLEREGYRVKVQDYDFGRGGDYVGDIHDALVAARHLFVLHTTDYDENYWTRKEFTNFLATLPESQGMRRICILRCDESMPRGILANVVFGDLVGVANAEERRKVILATAAGQPLQARSEPRIFGGSMPGKNANFTGRGRVLAQVENLMRGEPGSTSLVVVAICGLAGTGKTSVARACVDALAPEHSGVWWVNGQSRQDIVGGLAALGTRIDPRLVQESEVEKVARMALARIERLERPLLLALDNVDSPGDVDGLLPARGAHVLITSRRSDWHGRAHELTLDLMDEEEAVAFLQMRAGRKDEAGARRLARALGLLPLALDHAGAYVRHAMMSFDAYAKGLDKRLSKAPRDAPYPVSVAGTFSLAIENAVAECAAAEIALGQFAFYAPERIPLELLPESVLPEDERGDALLALTGVSLVRSDPLDDDVPGVSLHRLVQSAMRLRLAERDRAGAALNRAIATLAEAFPDRAYEDTTTWPRCDRLLAHAMAIREHASALDANTPAAPILFDRIGQYLHGRAMFSLAEAMYRNAIASGERQFGADSLEIARFKNNLANVLSALGRGGEAEPLLREALRLQEEKLGRSDPGRARMMTSLAWLLQEMGKSAEAEQLLREAIESCEATLGRGHPDMAVRINNLALVLQRSGHAEEAEALLREAIQAGERSLGRDHPVVLARLNNLASLLRDKGQTSEAEALFREALEAGTRSLGPTHTDIAAWSNNLANLLRDQGRYEDAEPLYREALATCELRYGARHPITGRIQRNFAVLQLATGHAEEARHNAEHALSVHADILGREHPWTRESAVSYAASLAALGRRDEADGVRSSHGLPLGTSAKQED
ncbi:Tetratricopeptide (TPR) repeat [Rhizobiales bacterium GAS191]|nr:Tetratricopeptide (TPR) repeat [Rhizobiales bacterium GAS191]SEF02547.1 Tetratricopeptide (TPR) repeat [Rhizobiales bacterium GAS188]